MKKKKIIIAAYLKDVSNIKDEDRTCIGCKCAIGKKKVAISDTTLTEKQWYHVHCYKFGKLVKKACLIDGYKTLEVLEFCFLCLLRIKLDFSSDLLYFILTH